MIASQLQILIRYEAKWATQVQTKNNKMLFIQNFKILFVVMCVCIILSEARPKPRPQDPEIPSEIIVEEGGDSSAYEDDDGPVIDADSFPLAPDVPHSGGVEDYHIRKLN